MGGTDDRMGPDQRSHSDQKSQRPACYRQTVEVYGGRPCLKMQGLLQRQVGKSIKAAEEEVSHRPKPVRRKVAWKSRRQIIVEIAANVQYNKIKRGYWSCGKKKTSQKVI